MSTHKLYPVRDEDIPRYINPHDSMVKFAERERWKIMLTGEMIVPWKTDMIGALVRYLPTFQHDIRKNEDSRPLLGAMGTVISGEWVSNASVGTDFCFYNILWHGVGCSEDMSARADFLTKTVRVVDLVTKEDK